MGFGASRTLWLQLVWMLWSRFSKKQGESHNTPGRDMGPYTLDKIENLRHFHIWYIYIYTMLFQPNFLLFAIIFRVMLNLEGTKSGFSRCQCFVRLQSWEASCWGEVSWFRCSKVIGLKKLLVFFRIPRCLIHFMHNMNQMMNQIFGKALQYDKRHTLMHHAILQFQPGRCYRIQCPIAGLAPKRIER